MMAKSGHMLLAGNTMDDEDPDRRLQLQRMLRNELTLILRAALTLGAALLILEGLFRIATAGRVAADTPAAATSVRSSQVAKPAARMVSDLPPAPARQQPPVARGMGQGARN
jgi:hypothetical protein